jgi:hypothetical protein
MTLRFRVHSDATFTETLTALGKGRARNNAQAAMRTGSDLIACRKFE